MRLCRRLTAIILLSFFSASCSDEPATAIDDAQQGDLRGARDVGSGGNGADSTDGGAGDVASESSIDDTAQSDTPTGDFGVDTTADGVPDALADTDSDGDSTCVAVDTAYTGTHILDFNGEPIHINDRMLITVTVYPLVGSVAATLSIETNNLDILAGTIQQDGAACEGASVEGGNIRLPIDVSTETEFTFEAGVQSDVELIVVLTHLSSSDAACIIGRSHSGAVLQVLGGVFKSPTCIDMASYRSLQIAPEVQVENIETYRDRNGRRDDLLSDDFIFCPENPTIVHVAEFCLEMDPDQTISLAGSHQSDGQWMVDDFTLVEVFEDTTLLADGFSTQFHPPGETFWCGDTATLMCTETTCTATLTFISEDREIEPFAEVTGQEGAANARTYNDGVVTISEIFPDDGRPVSVRITLLDVGVVGGLEPALYLISDGP